MPSLSCQTEAYSDLYARWMENPGRLLDLAGWKPGDRLLDLCGGSGAVSMEALRRGARHDEIVLLDLNPRCPAPIRQYEGRVDQLNALLPGVDLFDVIICRQAIGYLDLEMDLGLLLHQRLWHGGRFVFNSFVHPRWSLKTYKHGGRRFVEASGYLGHRVGHVQWSRDFGADVTSFRWHEEAELHRVLSPYFESIQVERTPKSLRWVCTKLPA